MGCITDISEGYAASIFRFKVILTLKMEVAFHCQTSANKPTPAGLKFLRVCPASALFLCITETAVHNVY
jgi:hypothetical protein